MSVLSRASDAGLNLACGRESRVCTLALKLNPVLRFQLILCVFFIGKFIVLVHKPASVEFPEWFGRS